MKLIERDVVEVKSKKGASGSLCGSLQAAILPKGALYRIFEVKGTVVTLVGLGSIEFSMSDFKKTRKAYKPF